MASLGGQVALVTGCARRNGLGREIARALAAGGADVVVTDLEAGGTRNVNEHADTAEEGWSGLPDLVEELRSLGVRAAATYGDVGSKSDADRMVEEAVAAFGRLDILVNNAAAPQGADRNRSWEVPEEAWDLVMQVNAKGPFLMSAAFVRHVLSRNGRGRIVNISSGAGRRGFPQRAAYSASKFAVIGLTHSMALELAAHNITVNAVAPGPVATARHRPTEDPAVPTDDVPFSLAIPVGRVGRPSDVARAVLFLADPEADFITGEVVHVTGGMILG
jgi:NAD(P)-dependent dehydrogenase (short-subunit alcohol dehydrogenase family)